MPYLESAGAQSVAVVSPHHLIVDQLVFGGAFGVEVVVKICLIMSESSVESKFQNRWALALVPTLVSTCQPGRLSIFIFWNKSNGFTFDVLLKQNPHSNAATFMKGGIYFHPAHPGLVVINSIPFGNYKTLSLCIKIKTNCDTYVHM